MFLTNKAKKKTKKDKKEDGAASSNPSTNGQVASTNSQNLVPQCLDEVERSKKIKKIKAVRIFIVYIQTEAIFNDSDFNIPYLLQKLDQITKLKEQLEAGKQLEINQLDKIKKEADLLNEMEKLSL